MGMGDSDQFCCICLEYVEASDFISHLCGKQCQANICTGCLAQHVSVTVYECIRGILPRVKCPICLVVMNLNCWKRYLEKDKQYHHLFEQYNKLAEWSLSFRCRSCHSAQYTHLPAASVDSPSKYAKELQLPAGSQDNVTELRRRCRLFCLHQLDARQVYDFIYTKWFRDQEDMAQLVLHRTLELITDDERRATLLLHHLRHRPSLKTTCCNALMCFNCKGLHESSTKCTLMEFEEETSLVQCRECYAMLLKMEGCSAVQCVCGFNMSWDIELQLRKKWRKKLFPAETFEEFVLVASKRDTMLTIINELCDMEKVKNKMRLQRLAHFLRTSTCLRSYIIQRLTKKRYTRCMQEIHRLNAWKSGQVVLTRTCRWNESYAMETLRVNLKPTDVLGFNFWLRKSHKVHCYLPETWRVFRKKHLNHLLAQYRAPLRRCFASCKWLLHFRMNRVLWSFRKDYCKWRVKYMDKCIEKNKQVLSSFVNRIATQSFCLHRIRTKAIVRNLPFHYDTFRQKYVDKCHQEKKKILRKLFTHGFWLQKYHTSKLILEFLRVHQERRLVFLEEYTDKYHKVFEDLIFKSQMYWRIKLKLILKKQSYALFWKTCKYVHPTKWTQLQQEDDRHEESSSFVMYNPFFDVNSYTEDL